MSIGLDGFLYTFFFFFFCAKDYMLSASFVAKIPSLYSYQNSWPVGPMEIYEQNLTELFFISIFTSIFTMIEILIVSS